MNIDRYTKRPKPLVPRSEFSEALADRLCASATKLTTVSFSTSFVDADYNVTLTEEGLTMFHAIVNTKSAGSFTFKMYDSAGAVIDPTVTVKTVNFECRGNWS